MATQHQQLRFSKYYDKLSRTIVENAVLDRKVETYGEELFYKLRGRQKFWKHNYQKLHSQIFDWPSEHGFMRVRNLLREKLKGDELMDHPLQFVSDPMMLHWETLVRWDWKEKLRRRHKYVWPEKQEAMTPEEMEARRASAKKKKKK